MNSLLLLLLLIVVEVDKHRLAEGAEVLGRGMAIVLSGRSTVASLGASAL